MTASAVQRSALDDARVAIVHDALVVKGGAERVVLALSELFPGAPIYTSVYSPEATFQDFRTRDVRPSFLQRYCQRPRLFRLAFPLFPLAFESFDLSAFDIVISCCAHWAKGVLPPPGALHLSYCHTPSRLAWRFHESLKEERLGRLGRALVGAYASYARLWDEATSRRVDHFVAGSRNAAQRIRRHYRREATVLESPIDVSRFTVGRGQGDYFLIVARLNGYKRVDLAVETFSRLGWPLVVVGDGPMRRHLERMAGPTVSFVGVVPEEQLAGYYAGCRALIVACEEDYGLTPLEAQASGRPVIAYGRGGVRETVLPGRTGLFFSEQSPESLHEALLAFLRMEFDPDVLRAHAARFDVSRFKARFLEILDAAYGVHLTEQART